MTSPTNAERIARARLLLNMEVNLQDNPPTEPYPEGYGLDDAAITDLLTDLMHFCAATNELTATGPVLVFQTLLLTAQEHFQAEWTEQHDPEEALGA